MINDNYEIDCYFSTDKTRLEKLKLCIIAFRCLIYISFIAFFGVILYLENPFKFNYCSNAFESYFIWIDQGNLIEYFIYSLGFGVASYGILANPLADRWRTFANEIKYLIVMQSNDINSETSSCMPASAKIWLILLDDDLGKLKMRILRYSYLYCIIAPVLLLIFSSSIYVGFSFYSISYTWKFIILSVVFLLGFGSLFLSTMFASIFYLCFSEDERTLKVYHALINSGEVIL